MAADSPSYSPGPYKKAVLDEAEYLVRLVYTNNQIVETKIDPKDAQKVREDLYVLIDGWVKKHYPSSILEFPKTDSASKGLMGPGNLFRLAERLEVWGAKLVADAFDTSVYFPSRVSVDQEGFSIRLDGAFLTIKAAVQPWSVTIPYHYMPGQRRRLQDKFGYASELAVVSTGYAKQAAKPGFSQATLMILVSERQDTEQFIRDWETLYKSTFPAEPCYWTIPNYSCKAVNKVGGTEVKGNLYFGSHGAYSIMISYMGLPETFNQNLPHARDFIQSISWGK